MGSCQYALNVTTTASTAWKRVLIGHLETGLPSYTPAAGN
jgi:hypothetical protein